MIVCRTSSVDSPRMPPPSVFARYQCCRAVKGNYARTYPVKEVLDLYLLVYSWLAMRLMSEKKGKGKDKL